MKRLNVLFAAMLVGFLSARTMSFAQDNSSRIKDAQIKEHVQEVYSCPMHPNVTSNRPGKCSNCGMELVLREEKKVAAEDLQESESSSAKEKIRQAQSLLAEAKKELAQDGKYNCCIKDPCDRCALDHQSCPCADEVKASKAVCPDCYAGWQRGDGIVKGIKASKVKGSFHSHKH